LIPEIPSSFISPVTQQAVLKKVPSQNRQKNREFILKGRIWLIRKDNIDTDMIFHNRYLSVTDIQEMGKYTFDNLKGYEDFSRNAKPGDIVISGKNFGSGSSRQQAVDCFSSLGIVAVIAESFGAIYERNAINAAFPLVTCKSLSEIDLVGGDQIIINLKSGALLNLRTNKEYSAEPFSDVQLEIYMKGGLLE
jgi:3-isopropylmalate/(R)-2-methylmalate dehydratase large subunit